MSSGERTGDIIPTPPSSVGTRDGFYLPISLGGARLRNVLIP